MIIEVWLISSEPTIIRRSALVQQLSVRKGTRSQLRCKIIMIIIFFYYLLLLLLLLASLSSPLSLLLYSIKDEIIIIIIMSLSQHSQTSSILCHILVDLEYTCDSRGMNSASWRGTTTGSAECNGGPVWYCLVAAVYGNSAGNTSSQY